MYFTIVTKAPDFQTASAWSDSVAKWEFATPFVGPEFMSDHRNRCLNPFAILALDATGVHGVVTGIEVDGVVNAGIACRPQLYIEPGAASETGVQIASGLREFARRRAKLVSVCAWEAVPALRSARYRERSFGAPIAPVVLELSKGAERLFQEFSERSRTRIRKAIRAGVSIEELAPTDFQTYYEIYSEWCAMKGIASKSYDEHEEQIRDRSGRLVLAARHEGRIIGASTFRFRRGGMMEYAANVSRREESSAHQNDLLLWAGIQRAIGLDCKKFSTGASHFFLQRFGGAIAKTYSYRLDMTPLRRYLIADTFGSLRESVSGKILHAIKDALKRFG